MNSFFRKHLMLCYVHAVCTQAFPVNPGPEPIPFDKSVVGLLSLSGFSGLEQQAVMFKAQSCGLSISGDELGELWAVGQPVAASLSDSTVSSRAWGQLRRSN